MCLHLISRESEVNRFPILVLCSLPLAEFATFRLYLAGKVINLYEYFRILDSKLTLNRQLKQWIIPIDRVTNLQYFLTKVALKLTTTGESLHSVRTFWDLVNNLTWPQCSAIGVQVTIGRTPHPVMWHISIGLDSPNKCNLSKTKYIYVIIYSETISM